MCFDIEFDQNLAIFFSQNTATTAIMIAAMLSLVKSLHRGSNFVRVIILAIPFSANIGGIATPVGTPPNAPIAIGLLASSNIKISFFQWMVFVLPPMIALLIVLWLLLLLFFPLKKQEVILKNKSSNLIGGGISIGVAIEKSGLDEIIVQSLNIKNLHPVIGTLIISSFVAILATFISHTASSNLMIPIALKIGMHTTFPVVAVAMCSSFGMALPVSTPPNAIAYGSGELKLKDMVKVGIIITIIAVSLTLFYESIIMLK